MRSPLERFRKPPSIQRYPETTTLQQLAREIGQGSEQIVREATDIVVASAAIRANPSSQAPMESNTQPICTPPPTEQKRHSRRNNLIFTGKSMLLAGSGIGIAGTGILVNAVQEQSTLKQQANATHPEPSDQEYADSLGQILDQNKKAYDQTRSAIINNEPAPAIDVQPHIREAYRVIDRENRNRDEYSRLKRERKTEERGLGGMGAISGGIGAALIGAVILSNAKDKNTQNNE